MTSAARASRKFADLFISDPITALVSLVRDAGSPLDPAGIREAARSRGVEDLDVPMWRRLQRRFRNHENIALEGGAYRWVADPPVPAAVDVFAELVRIAGNRVRSSHLRAVEEVLFNTPSKAEIAARERQATIDAARRLAELAGEVEELVANDAADQVLIHRIRTHAKRSGLEAIERAGDIVAYDPKLHRPITPPINDGAQVRVVRPGYVWRKRQEEVLVSKAEVKE